MTWTAMLTAFAAGFTLEPPEPGTLVFPPYGHCMGIYRAGEDQLAILLGGLVRFDDPQGLACVKLSAWDSQGESDDDELAVYGVNSGSGHVIYNATMFTLGLYGGEGGARDQLSSPHGIAADPDGRVVVADTGNRRLVCLRRADARLSPVRLMTHGLVEPWGVALSSSGEIWATDRAAGAVLVFSSPSDTMPEVIPLERPTGIAVYGGGRWDHDADDRFAAVVCGDGSRLVTLEDGAVTGEAVPSDCGGSVFNYPVIDYYGSIWVSDSAACMIHKFDRNLRHLASFGSPGTGDRELDHPTGLAIWRRYGQIFVAERKGARYFWIGTDLLDIDFTALAHGFELTGWLTEPSNILAQVEDDDGVVVRTVHNGRAPSGAFECSWDGTDVSGRRLPGGAYRLVARIEPTYSSRGYFWKTLEQDFSITGPSGTGEEEQGGRR